MASEKRTPGPGIKNSIFEITLAGKLRNIPSLENRQLQSPRIFLEKGAGNLFGVPDLGIERN